ncbi:MAG: hypothetical protein EA412_07790 [Chitinophagaceae bacterium]|nr:MAG: hypothetical protein EA412_07790 [Chitinophagaceae bacterium]
MRYLKHFFFILFLFQLNEVFAVKQLEILHADRLTMTERGGQKTRLLEGNVGLKQDDAILYCDKAFFYIDVNRVDAIGNVRVVHNDTTELFADTVFYFGDRRKVEARRNVRIVEGNKVLKTHILDYYLDREVAYYFSGGEFTENTLNLKSESGFINMANEQATFYKNVILIDEGYTIFADTLKYNTRQSQLVFYRNTRIVTDQQVIYCDNGFFNTKTDEGVFGRNTRVVSGHQILESDSLHYNADSGEGISERYFVWTDTIEKIIISGHYGIYNRETEQLMATRKPMMKSVMDNDTLFLTADTLFSGIDTSENRYLIAHRQSRFFKEDLQGFADSLSFSYEDSIIRMMYNPVVWQENTQLSGDTILIMMKNNQLDEVELIRNAFLIEYEGDEVYNQIKGRHIHGYFAEGSLKNMEVTGNAESVYFGKDDNDRYIGVNRVVAAGMSLFFLDNNIERIHFRQSPEAGFYPIGNSHPSEYHLSGFNWRTEYRPLSKADLLNPIVLLKEETEQKEKQPAGGGRERTGVRD